MISPDISVYPFKDVAPARVNDVDFYLHAAVQWQNGIKQQLGMVTADTMVEPPVPVHRYVGFPISRTRGFQQQDTIEVRAQAQLQPHDLTLLRDAIDNFGLVWSYGEGRNGSGLVYVPQTILECNFGEGEERLNYRVSSPAFMLGCLRALAQHNLQRSIATHN